MICGKSTLETTNNETREGTSTSGNEWSTKQQSHKDTKVFLFQAIQQSKTKRNIKTNSTNSRTVGWPLLSQHKNKQKMEWRSLLWTACRSLQAEFSSIQTCIGYMKGQLRIYAQKYMSSWEGGLKMSCCVFSSFINTSSCFNACTSELISLLLSPWLISISSSKISQR